MRTGGWLGGQSVENLSPGLIPCYQGKYRDLARKVLPDLCIIEISLLPNGFRRQFPMRWNREYASQ